MRRSYVAIATLILTAAVLLFIYAKPPHLPANIFHYIPSKTHVKSLEEELQTLYDGVQTIVLFVGHARSGHSLVGAILDAHPEMIIANEFNLITKWRKDYKTQIHSARLKNRIFFDLHSFSREQAMFRNRAPCSTSERKGYCYHVPGQWQGKYRDKLKVIGDKKGTATSRFLRSAGYRQVLDEMQGALKAPLKFIHVIRNPFDNIATKLLRRLDSRELAHNEGFKVNNSHELDDIITSYFANVESAQKLHDCGKFEVFDIYGHEIISQPQKNLKKLCNFLEVACDRDYIDACSKLLYSKPSLTRNSVVWTKEQIRRVTMEMKKYSFMGPYSFSSL